MPATYEWQPGGLVAFGSLFYYGKLAGISKGDRTRDRWFNTDHFKRISATQPAAYHRRVFPVHIDGVRADSANIWNANLQREFRFSGRVRLQFGFHALNLFNHTTLAGLDSSPTLSHFTKVTNIAGALPRFVRLQGKLRF